MKRPLALSAFLLPICLFAQGFGSFSHDQPFLASSSTGGSTPPDFLTGLALQWVSSDVATNTKLAKWPDRIQTNNATQATVGFQCTNRAGFGVRFDEANNNWFDITNFTANFTNGVYVFLCTMDTIGANDRAIFGVIPNTSALIGQHTDGNLMYGAAAGTTAAKFRNNTLSEVILASIQGDTNLTAFTNGVMAQTNLNYDANFTVGYMGRRNGFNWMNGYIREIRYYTNKITLSNVQSIHASLTNTYGYTP